MANAYCPSCYGPKVYCRKHKTTHCGCTWNSRTDCITGKMDKDKAKKPARRVDRSNNNG